MGRRADQGKAGNSGGSSVSRVQTSFPGVAPFTGPCGLVLVILLVQVQDVFQNDSLLASTVMVLTLCSLTYSFYAWNSVTFGLHGLHSTLNVPVLQHPNCWQLQPFVTEKQYINIVDWNYLSTVNYSQRYNRVIPFHVKFWKIVLHDHHGF